MKYLSLEENLEEIISCTDLDEAEKIILKASYISPGITKEELQKLSTYADKIIEKLVQQGLLLKKEDGKQVKIYPIPLVLLIQNYTSDEKMRNTKEFTASLKNIDQWIRYPLMRNPNIKIRSAEDTCTAVKWLFELHNTDWERVYCFGDYESFIDTIGIDVETSWIKERIAKIRKASVIATKDGKWAQLIKKTSKKELRDCIIEPKDFSELFIMAFPDIHTTVIGSADGDITFIHSSSIADSYSGLVERHLGSA